MVEVKVNEGVLEGEKVTSDLAGTFYSFKGIPYAAPPIGDLRFKEPQPPIPWSGVRSAKECGSQCHQYNLFTKIPERGSEDCLSLNIYTPVINPSVALPVMIYIHGGSFCSGNGNDDTYGPEFLIRHGVILVTINYRLEVLGFLCLDTEDVPGNAGIKDQVAAMKWVKNNITSFGGDPNNITIFGQSSGGACVTYHCVSPMTKGLFKRAIAQSGTMMSWAAHSYRPRERAVALARHLGCTSEDDKELFMFFKNQPWENLVGILQPLLWNEKNINILLMQFSVVSEKRFPGIEPYFCGDIREALQNDIHEGVELIVGYNEDDGVISLVMSLDLQTTVDSAKQSDFFFIPMILSHRYSKDEVLEAGNKMKNFYTRGKPIMINDLSPITNFITAQLYKFDVIQLAKYFAVKNKTYVYKFSCASERNLFSKIYGLSHYFTKPTVCHNDDIPYLFPMKIINQVISKKSDTFAMIDRMTRLWTNFAKTGNPTPDTKLGCNWKPFNAKTQPYLNIGNKLVRGVLPDKEEIEVWEEIYEKYVPEYLYRPN